MSSDDELASLKAARRAADDKYNAEVFSIRENEDTAYKIIKPLWVIAAGTCASLVIVGGSFYLAANVEGKSLDCDFGASEVSLETCLEEDRKLTLENMAQKGKIVSTGAKIGCATLALSFAAAFLLSGGFRSRRELGEALQKSEKGYLARGKAFHDRDVSGIKVIENDKI